MNAYKKNKALLTLALLLVMTMLLSACSTKDKIPSNVVAIVNGNEIPVELYDNTLALYKMNYERQFGPDMLTKDTGSGTTLLDTIKGMVLEKLILDELLLQKAKENNITISKEEVEEAYEPYYQLTKEDEEYAAMLEENNLTEEFIKAQIEKEMMIYQYRLFFQEQNDIDEADAQEFYDDNTDIFQSEKIRARHILVDDKAIAEQLIQRINEGESFEELAKQYGTDGTKDRGGDLDYFTRGDMVPEFERAAFALEIGELTQEPVQTAYGYHLIFLEDRIAEGQDFDMVKWDIIEYLKSLQFEEYIDELMEQAEITKRENL